MEVPRITAITVPSSARVEFSKAAIVVLRMGTPGAEMSTKSRLQLLKRAREMSREDAPTTIRLWIPL